MVWAIVDEEVFSPSDDGQTKFIRLPLSPGIVAWAVSVEVPAAVTTPRRRLGFVAPFVGIDGRQLVGPSEAVFRNLSGQPLALHHVGFAWLNDYTGLSGRPEGYGVAISPDRGAFPATFSLWALT